MLQGAALPLCMSAMQRSILGGQIKAHSGLVRVVFMGAFRLFQMNGLQNKEKGQKRLHNHDRGTKIEKRMSSAHRTIPQVLASHKAGATIFSVLVFSVGAVMNAYADRPKFIYILAAVLTLFIWWGAHYLVQSLGNVQASTNPADTILAAPDGPLLPGNESNPAQPVAEFLAEWRGRDLKPLLLNTDTLKVIFGSNLFYFTKDFKQQSMVLLRVDGRELLSMKRSGAGLLLDAIVLDERGVVIAQIDSNKIYSNQNNVFRIDRPDPHTLTVYNLAAEKVLRVSFLNSSTITISGLFRRQNKPTMEIKDNEILFGGRPSGMRRNIYGNVSNVAYDIN